jgi:cob(I)alamin adenosyltransferase
MSLFTGKGDDGTTYAFGCDQRFTKSSALAEALGTCDEVNSFLGFAKLKSRELDYKLPDGCSIHELVGEIQQNLFIVQAELAGADKKIEQEKVDAMSDLINQIEKEMPLIKSFFVSGGVELSTMFDFARTLSRRAERRVVAVAAFYKEVKESGGDTDQAGIREVSSGTLAYMNRLSSMLYALARYSNHLAGIKEEAPHYK